LATISPGTLATGMTNHRARTIGDPIAGLLKPPAKVHVVARFSILTIEAVDGFQSFAAKCHVAPGNVLGHLVRFQDVSRLPRRGSYTGCQPAIVGSQIGSPHGRGIGALELVNEMDEPMLIDETIGIGISDDRAAGRPIAHVAGSA